MDKISRSFQGTYSIDNIPTIKNNDFSIIINLSKQYKKGSHFVAIFNKQNRIIYFDSLGSQNIHRTLQKYIKNIKNKSHIQMFNYNTYSVIIVDFLYVIHFMFRK